MANSTRAADPTSGSASSALRLGTSAKLIVPLMGVALLIAILDWLNFLWRALHAPVGQYDFSSYYAAALAIRHNPHANLYSPGVMARAGALGHVQVQPPLPYTYPPLMAILLSPLTVLSFHLAARLWLLVNAGLCLAVVVILACEVAVVAGVPLQRARQWLVQPSLLSALAIAATSTLASAPARQTILTGQVDLLVLLPLALVPWLLRAQHDVWAGAAVAFAAMLKLTPGLLLLYFLLRGRWKAFWGCVASLVVLSALSIAVVGPANFAAAIPEALQVGSGDTLLGQNEALLAPLASGSAGRVLLYVALALLATGLGWLVWRIGRRADTDPTLSGGDADSLAYGIALCGVLLLAPTAWVHHYVWVLPAIAIASGGIIAIFAREPAASRSTMLLATAVVLAAILIDLALPHAWDTQPHPAITTLAGLPLRPALLEARAAGTILIVVALASLGLRKPRGAPAQMAPA